MAMCGRSFCSGASFKSSGGKFESRTSISKTLSDVSLLSRDKQPPPGDAFSSLLRNLQLEHKTSTPIGARNGQEEMKSRNPTSTPVMFDCSPLYGISMQKHNSRLDHEGGPFESNFRKLVGCSFCQEEGDFSNHIHLHPNSPALSPAFSCFTYSEKCRGKSKKFIERLSDSQNSVLRTCCCDRHPSVTPPDVPDGHVAGTASVSDQRSGSLPVSLTRFCFQVKDDENPELKAVMLSTLPKARNRLLDLQNLDSGIGTSTGRSFASSWPELYRSHIRDSCVQKSESGFVSENGSACSVPPFSLMFMSSSCGLRNFGSGKSLDLAAFAWDELSKDIFQHYIRNHQSNVQLRAKLQLRDILQKTVATVFPSSGLYIVGSSLNGFGSRRSDMDLCLMLTSKAIDQKRDAVTLLKLLASAFERNEIVQNQQLIEAKVPILRLKFRGPFEDISVDLNVNNSVGIKNTHLLYYYSNWDWRVKPLVLTIKEWARQQGINDASQSTLSSYSLVLMILHYLQCGASPPILPALQKLYPQKFHDRIDVRFLNMREALYPDPSSVFVTFNVQSLGELFLGFLEYYAFIFNFEEDAISVRCGSKIPRGIAASCNPLLNYPSSWKCLYIEEPFTLSNTAYSVYNEHVFSLVKQTFVRSFEVLRYRRRMSIVMCSPGSDD